MTTLKALRLEQTKREFLLELSLNRYIFDLSICFYSPDALLWLLMKSLVLVIALLFCIPSNAEPLEPSLALKKFRSLSVKKDHPTVFKGEKTISAYIGGQKVKHEYTLDPNLPKNKGWTSTHLTGYKNKNNRISQVSISSSLCNLGSNKEAIITQELQKLESYIGKVAQALFDVKISVDIGSKKSSLKNRLWIKSENKQIKKMRIMTGKDKCDSRGGVFYRFDFFI